MHHLNNYYIRNKKNLKIPNNFEHGLYKKCTHIYTHSCTEKHAHTTHTHFLILLRLFYKELFLLFFISFVS